MLRHFRLCHAASLQFVENEIKRSFSTLPCNQDQRLVLSIIPTLIDAGSGLRFGFWFEGAIIALSTLDLEERPVTLEGAISVYRRGSVIEFIKKKEGESGEIDVDNIINFVECNGVKDVHLEEHIKNTL